MQPVIIDYWSAANWGRPHMNPMLHVWIPEPFLFILHPHLRHRVEAEPEPTGTPPTLYCPLLTSQGAHRLVGSCGSSWWQQKRPFCVIWLLKLLHVCVNLGYIRHRRSDCSWLSLMCLWQSLMRLMLLQRLPTTFRPKKCDWFCCCLLTSDLNWEWRISTSVTFSSSFL